MMNLLYYGMLLFKNKKPEFSICPWSFLQTSIFNVQPHAQKDHNSNEIFVMGAAHCAAPMTKISLLLWSF